MLAAMNVGFESVTHLVVDLRDAVAPDERLEAVARRLRKSSDKRLAKLRLWTVGPGQVAGLKEIRRVLAPGGWFMTALEMAGGAMNERQLAIVEHLKMRCPDLDELRGLLLEAGFADVTAEFESEHRWLRAFGRK